MVCSDKGLQGCWFVGQKHFPKNILRTPTQQTPLSARHHRDAAEELRLYFDNQIDKFNVALDLDHLGTLFQREVWLSLLNIPLGQTMSYSDIAHQIKRPNAIRAVGSAIGRNPISIIVPCHRVISKSGALTGYAGGIERKKFLLTLETDSAQVKHPRQAQA